MYIKAGSYTGDGVAGGQAITGVGFQPRIVLVKRDNATNPTLVRIEGMAANSSKSITGANAVSTTSAIKSLDADGFTVSNDNANVNQAATTYMYLAIGGEGTDFQYGTYTGDGSDSRDITIGGTFSGTPDLVIIVPETAVRCPWRSSDFTGDDSMNFSQAHTTNLIQAFGSGTFQVGTGMNTGSTVYDWVAFKKVTGFCTTYTYTGNNTDDRNLTSFGFQPTFALTQGNDARLAVVRNAGVHSGDDSCDIAGSAADAANMIQSFISDGIQVGTDSKVNANTITYYGFAFKDATSSINSTPNPVVVNVLVVSPTTTTGNTPNPTVVQVSVVAPSNSLSITLTPVVVDVLVVAPTTQLISYDPNEVWIETWDQQDP